MKEQNPKRKRNTSTAGKMMMLEGSLLLVPLLGLPFYPEDGRYAYTLMFPAILSILAGLVTGRIGKQITNSNRLVVFSWGYGFFLATIPFLLLGDIPLVHAVFEAVSGFTTTGLSVLEVEKLPNMFLFYRAFLQYVGGIGFVVTMLLFVQEKDFAMLFQAEGHPDRLMPDMGKTAKVIVFIYGFFLLLGSILYTLCGMSPFDSILHTMCALSTGGFSNKMDSIGYYHSLSIELVTVVLMLIGTTNFAFLLLLMKGRWKDVCKASEIRFLAGLVVICVPLMSLFLAWDGTGVGKAFRLSFFNAFSALSTTGYATCQYGDWSECALVLMILLMMIGGGLGSTAGGMKLARICILLKDLWRSVKKKMVSERRVILTYYHRGTDQELLERDQVEEASTYAGCYLLIYIIGTFLLAFFSKSSFLESAFEFASSLGTVGLSIGITNPNAPNICLVIEMIGMILGRLEIFVILKAIFGKARC